MGTQRLTPQQQFIVDLYPAAVRISRETGSSWELILAQAAQETGWGRKVLPGTNNIFNIKASGDWNGARGTFNVPEVENGRTVWKDQEFRIYSSVDEALRDRVAFLRDNPRYAKAGFFDRGVRGDPEREAGALQRAGYATDPEYADKMIRVFNGPTMQSAIRYAREHASRHAAASSIAHHQNRPNQGAAAVEVGSANAAIFTEAYLHFIASGNTFEYGRGDSRSRNREGSGLTDPSRNEVDADGDGLKGVDCSSFVWRGLKNAGYDVPPNTARHPFTTHTLFDGHSVTDFARRNFDVIPGTEADDLNGPLRVGDILCFRKKGETGQHVAIFSGYDKLGIPHFIGSQTHKGPAFAAAAPGTYWNGQDFEIVAALRAKPDFHVVAPLHGPATDLRADVPNRSSSDVRQHVSTVPQTGHAPSIEHVLRQGEKSSAITTLQRRLFDLDYRRPNGKPLDIDGDFGTDTLFALKHFQREHGLQGKGVAGPKTEAALERAERTLISSLAHPHHALYAQTLDKVREAEKARGIAVGPHSERIAAALTVECIRKGIGQVDRVEINNEKTLVRGVHDCPGNAESGLGNTDMISLPRASSQSMMESSRQCHEAAIDASARSAATLQQHRQPATHAMVH
jgi:cell wall-associated NlpC family hydrolase